MLGGAKDSVCVGVGAGAVDGGNYEKMFVCMRMKSIAYHDFVYFRSCAIQLEVRCAGGFAQLAKSSGNAKLYTCPNMPSYSLVSAGTSTLRHLIEVMHTLST